ncbi:uncharacterized protein METZ01_LOCUS452033, partial [marine metagenome]
DPNKFYKNIADLIRYIIEEKGLNVHLVPHIHSDYNCIVEILSHLSDKHIRNNIMIESLEQSNSGMNHMISSYGNAEYVIACRLHANVVSLCCKSKVLAIATLDRIRELYRKYGIEQNCTDVTSDFKESFDQLCKNSSVPNLEKINLDKLKTIKTYSGLLKKFGII